MFVCQMKTSEDLRCLIHNISDVHKQFFINGCGFAAVNHAHSRVIAGADDFFISYTEKYLYTRVTWNYI